MSEKLKKCHCGAQVLPPMDRHATLYPDWVITCIRAACRWSVSGFNTAEKAIEAWNNRPIEKALQGRIAILEKGLQDMDNSVGKWLSASLEDPDVCNAMKEDVQTWFNVLGRLFGDKYGEAK